MNDRIKELLDVYGLSANKFASRIGVQASGISHILSGRNKPGYDFIVKVLENFPEVNPDWLLLGKGTMARNSVSSINDIKDETNHIDNKSKLFEEKSSTDSNVVPESNFSPEREFDVEENMRDDNITSNSKLSAVPIITNKKIESVIIFYCDRTFISYKPE